MLSSVLALLLFAPPDLFQVAGEVVSPSTRFERVDIESMDQRFVATNDVDSRGRFAFAKIPEGMYKLIFISASGDEHYRTIEVRPAFADPLRRVSIKIELRDLPLLTEGWTVGVRQVNVSPKAEKEMRRAYDGRANVRQAREHLEKAIAISPEYDEALNNLGAIHHSEGNFETALGLFDRALKTNPASFAARVNRAATLMAMGNYAQAIDDNLKAVRLRPYDSLAQAQTGQTLFHLRRYREAIPYLEKAREIDPFSFTLPGVFLGWIYQTLGEDQSAIAEYREFLRMHPGSESVAIVKRQLQALESSGDRVSKD